jgi:hypothetical protein
MSGMGRKRTFADTLEDLRNRRPCIHLGTRQLIPAMWMESDDQYFSRRARQERVAAGQARHPVAREAHLAMAMRFEEVALRSRELRRVARVLARPPMSVRRATV